MTDHAALVAHLTDSLGKCLEYGHWAFHDLRGRLAGHSDQRIVVEAMYDSAPGWAELAADGILSQPTGGVIVLTYPWVGMDWARPIKRALEQRGAELPVCGV